MCGDVCVARDQAFVHEFEEFSILESACTFRFWLIAFPCERISSKSEARESKGMDKVYATGRVARNSEQERDPLRKADYPLREMRCESRVIHYSEYAFSTLDRHKTSAVRTCCWLWKSIFENAPQIKFNVCVVLTFPMFLSLSLSPIFKDWTLNHSSYPNLVFLEDS